MKEPPIDAQVLIVDDAAVDRMLAGNLVEKHLGMKAMYANNGVQALDILREARPVLVLTDLQMPEMDGLELMTVLREERPQLPVVIVTAHGSEELAVQALKNGAANYVTKKNMVRDLGPVLESVLTGVESEQHRQRMLACMTQNDLTFRLRSEPALVAPLVNYLQDTLNGMQFGNPNARIRTRVAIEEAIVNALHHGNLEVSSELRRHGDKPYRTMVEQRARISPYKDRFIHVEARMRPTEVTFTIRDEGPGFDLNTLPDPTDPANLERPSGRGLLLIRTFMDEVRYNAAGNEITMAKRAS